VIILCIALVLITVAVLAPIVGTDTRDVRIYDKWNPLRCSLVCPE
jgi:hypothetical protein